MSAPVDSPLHGADTQHLCDKIDFELIGTDCWPRDYPPPERKEAKLTLQSLQNEAKNCETCRQLADLIQHRLEVDTSIHDFIKLQDAANISLIVAVRDFIAVQNWSFGSGGYTYRTVLTIWLEVKSGDYYRNCRIVLQRAGPGGRVPVEVDPFPADRNESLPYGYIEFRQPGSWRVDKTRGWFLLNDETIPRNSIPEEGGLKKVVGALHPTFGRPRPLVIDFDILRNWMGICEQHHSICQYDREPVSIPRFRLIDINKKCVVQAGDSKRPPFATLSYVWGRKPFLRLVKANIEELEKEGCLERLELPPTIEDAITVCEKLRIGYLWIDSLCIVQDDESVMLEVVDKMDSVYREGILTIVAASGADAYSGIPGVRPNTRFLEQRPLEIRGMQLIDSVDENEFRIYTHLKDHPEWVSHTPWSRRAWTFQEALVSRRSLFFTSEQVYWSCREGLMSEDTTEHLDLEAFGKPEEDRRDSLFNPHEYEGIVASFCTRYLTYEADMGRAFQATQNYLEKKWPGFKLSWGLPHTSFGICLMWEWPFDENRRLRKGTHAVRQHDDTVVKVPYPSWSWMAWTEGPRLNVSGLSGYGTESLPHSPWFFVFDSALDLVAIPYGEGWNPSTKEVSPLEKLLSNEDGFRREAVTEDVLPTELHVSPSLRHIALSFYTEVVTVRYHPSDVISEPPKPVQKTSREYPFPIKVGNRFYQIFAQDQEQGGMEEIDLVAVFGGLERWRNPEDEYKLYCWPIVKKSGLRQRASDASTCIFLSIWRELPGIRWELVTLI
ncbi:hypothetical protein NW768_008036 [Fusarium equiseti]|uniref:Heterokaryon incompatibility domain-containing protein n=1 Tax=Fusarium equiseti TaxID=61235 RepID=A0ABQ8R5W5_FUSEQ|nr:hypothetical protein NW768_008036 [Fusarium equiseti]